MRRRLVRLLVVLGLAVVFAQFVVVPAVGIALAAYAPKHAVTLPGLREVRFPARDGVTLAGSYAAPRNGAAVVVLHGSHGDRTDTARHVALLRRLGYGVLAVDARGHGESGGRANALGWRGVDDVAGAVAYLRAHGARRVAALGLSMGAEEALRAAADGVRLDAVVADGAGASTLGDRDLVEHGLLKPIAVGAGWLAMRGIEVATWAHEPQPLADAVRRVAPPTLLIASDAKDEAAFDSELARRIEHAQLLRLHVEHTEGLRTKPTTYGRRVAGFLALALAE